MRRWHRIPVWTACFALFALTPRADAQLRVHAPVLALGEVRGGPDRICRFDFTNQGDAAIEMLDVERGCGCLAPRLEKRTLAPGESSHLELVLRTLGHKDGKHAWNAVIRYRSGDQIKAAPLRLEGTVRNEVTVEPSALALHVSGDMRHSLHVVDLRERPFAVKGAEVALPGVKATAVALGGGRFRIDVVAVADLPAGRHDGIISIHTDDAAYAPLTIPLTVVRAGKSSVLLAPERIRLDPAAGIRTAVLRLRPRGDEPIRISSVQCSHAQVKCTWCDSADAGSVIRLTCGEGTMPLPATVRVIIAAPTAEVIEVPIDWE